MEGLQELPYPIDGLQDPLPYSMEGVQEFPCPIDGLQDPLQESQW